MFSNVSIDFETRSACDLRLAGLDNYSKHPSTDALCVGFAIDDQPVDLLAPEDFRFAPFLDHVREGGIITAWNVAFELAIWNNVMVRKYGWPKLPVEQCRCRMVESYAMALPGALENAAPAAGLKHEKDMAGHRIMMQLSQPREVLENGDVEWWIDAEKTKKLYEYCKQDVVVEREMGKRLVSLTPSERELWLLDQKINNRGMKVDIPAVKKAIEIVKLEQSRLNERIRELSCGAIATCTAIGQLQDYLKWNGIHVESVDKSHIVELLADKGVPENIRDILTLRQEAGKSSTAKLEAMVKAASSDGRLRGMFQFTAAGTRRWAGRRVQLHNMPRPKLSPKDIDSVFKILHTMSASDALEHIRILYGSPLSVISDCIRGFLVPDDGNELVGGDFSNVEGRVLAWLAGEEWKLNAFRGYDRGELPDIYIQTYSRSFHVPLNEVTDDQRQIGKVEELALGFGGGEGAFAQMAKGYGVKVNNAGEIKDAWREAHPAIVQYWRDLNTAALRALYNPGTVFMAGPDNFPNRKVKYKVNGSFLWCQLPSGGLLSYPYPKIFQQVWVGLQSGGKGGPVKQKTFHGNTAEEAMLAARKYAEANDYIVRDISAPQDCVSYMGWNETAKRWERLLAYGGFFSENVTQSLSRDLLAAAMLRIDCELCPIVLHVHDELNCEVKKGWLSKKAFEQKMTELPAWAKDLPIAAKASIRNRYGK